jgi:rhodanese-related sulfurtransferase
MKTITLDELKSRFERSEPLQLVMALTRWHFDRLHIPGSQLLEDFEEAASSMTGDQEVIVYCTNPACPASYRLYYLLKNLGFEKVVRFEGGIEAWMEAGLPMEGALAQEMAFA